MKYRQRLFIYDSREIVVLVLLVGMVSVFTFTLGVHLGKRVGVKVAGFEMGDTPPIATLPDQIPNRQEFTEQSKGTQQALEETLNHELHDEVTRTGIKLDTPRQVDLPKKPKSKNAGATTLSDSSAKASTKSEVESPRLNEGVQIKQKYTLQIGSYPSLEEAKKQLASLNQSELKPFLREAEIKGKGKWYRLYAGGFLTRGAAELAGEQYRSRHLIASFIVANLSD